MSEQRDCKGYPTAEGYMGYVDGKYQLFATEGDYREFIGGNEDGQERDM